MKNDSAVMNSALAAIVALGGFGFADDAIAVQPKGKKSYGVGKAGLNDRQMAASACAETSEALRADHIMESRHAIWRVVMLSLHELQLRFAEAISIPERAARACPSGTMASRAGAVRIYRNNVFISLTEALKACYPVVERLVGEGFFAAAAMRYIHAHPSTSGDLHEFGSDFPEFLEDYPPAKALVYLPDVARLEWARQEVYHAAEAATLDLAALAAVPPERYGDLRFRFHPAGRFSAAVLFVFNIVAMISYPGLNPVGVEQHQVWGIMLLVTLLHGSGKLSLDHWIGKRFFGEQ